ncbi:helix-turn-helix domain-containing protein [Lutimaribacter pacificus]|uniref:helix-turn-helix domain-containing protein n=1 Tax=Lutimaribacter pacificus TaxID=391948 RepID=UPI00122D3C0F|nr:helix-turn-helix transcriptional regulator [Lutimaribacter pacificus]
MSEKTDKDLLTAFATVLRRERQRAGLSQEELAHRAGKSMRYISLLESCRHQPSLSTLRGLCDGLGIRMSDFVLAIEEELTG